MIQLFTIRGKPQRCVSIWFYIMLSDIPIPASCFELDGLSDLPESYIQRLKW